MAAIRAVRERRGDLARASLLFALLAGWHVKIRSRLGESCCRASFGGPVDAHAADVRIERVAGQPASLDGAAVEGVIEIEARREVRGKEGHADVDAGPPSSAR